MKAYFLAVVIATLGGDAFAQSEDLNARDPRMNEGKMFTVKLFVGDKRLVVSLAGNPAIEADASRVMVFGREISKSGKSRRLKIVPSDSQFEIVDAVGLSEAIQIDVEDKATKKKETFEFKMNSRP